MMVLPMGLGQPFVCPGGAGSAVAQAGALGARATPQAEQA